MKTYLKKIAFSSLIYLALIVGSSLLFSLLRILTSTPGNTYTLISRILSFFYALGFGMIGGLWIRKKGILDGLLFALIYLIMVGIGGWIEPLIFVDHGIFVLIKCLLIVAGSVIGVNLHPLK